MMNGLSLSGGGAFAPSIVVPPVSAVSSIIGWNPPPAPAIAPFTSQSANTGLRALIGGHPSSDVLNEALFSADAGAGTFEALDRVAQAADASRNRELAWLERFARATLMMRTGGSLDEAYYILIKNSPSDWSELNKPAFRALYMQSLLAETDVLLQLGALSNGKTRAGHFRKARERLATMRELESGILHADIAEPSDEVHAVEKRLVSSLYACTAAFMMERSFPMWAYETVLELVDFYPWSEAVKAAASSDSPLRVFFDEKGGLKKKGEFKDSPLAGTREFIARAKFETNFQALKYMAGGSALGMLTTALAGAGSHFPAVLHAAGIGALAMFTAGKAVHGAMAEETEQAWKTGISRQDLAGPAVRELAKLGAAYAFFGGDVPLAGLLADVPVLGATVALDNGMSGQFYGLGSFFAWLFSSASQELATASQFIRDRGVSDGLGAFWGHYSRGTVFGGALKAGADFWSGFAGYVANELPSDAIGGLRNMVSDPLSLETALRTYKMAGVSWAGATMLRPELRQMAMEKHPRLTRAVELALLPAGYFFGVDVGEATGVESFDAHIISAIGMASQPIYHWMAGGTLDDLDLANVFRNAAVPALYAGVGGHMVVPHYDPTVANLFANSMGIQIGFIPVSFVHGLLLKFPLKRFWQNKLHRSYTAENFGNFARLLLGFSTWKGTLVAELLQGFVQIPWMTKVRQEPVGGAPQRGTLRKRVRPAEFTPDEIAKRAQEMEDFARKGGRRWPLLQPLTGKTVVERLPMATAYLFTMLNKPEPFATEPEEEFYRMIYQELARGGRKAMPAEYVEQYLGYLDVIARDLSPRTRDVRRGLLVATYAAREGAHGRAIEKFFSERRWLFDYYALPVGQLPPEGGLLARMKQPAWFREHLRG